MLLPLSDVRELVPRSVEIHGGRMTVKRERVTAHDDRPDRVARSRTRAVLRGRTIGVTDPGPITTELLDQRRRSTALRFDSIAKIRYGGRSRSPSWSSSASLIPLDV
jgi:hypothetical protein